MTDGERATDDGVRSMGLVAGAPGTRLYCGRAAACTASRWGSCSAAGTISLNWRLLQTPDLVRDYIIHHEMAHLREMNHSDRFWSLVGETFPAWREAERWIRRNSSLVGL